ncbi:MAG: bacterial Ig-like domain-containing protein, partial [Clostridia bacterium]|nr:bacterial Ig-like domain-containing protein [Clostridia bacterium]
QQYGMTGALTTEVINAVINSMSVEQADGYKALSYPFTIDDVKANYDVYLSWNFAPLELLADADKVTVALKDGGELTAGTLSFLFTYTDGALTTTSDPVDIQISKGTYDVSGITFTGGSPITYNGQAHSIEYSGTLPAGVGVQYTYGGTTQSTPFEFTEADDYEITLSFTQDDTDNYEVITKTITATLKIIDAVMTDITVNFEQGDTVVYPSTDLDTLKDLITVTAAYNNGTSQEITDYELSGEFTVGESQITVTYGGFTKTITVNVTAIALDRIEAAFTQGGAVYPSTGLDTLKDWITVTAYYNDESEEVVSDYELSGELTYGESQITVSYNGKDYVITVDVTAIELVRIEVEFEQDGEVYPTSALSVLKPWLKVTAYYNDESEEVVSGYELTGALTAGESEITVTYGGLDKSISVEVTEVPILCGVFSFTKDGVVYPSSNLEVLRRWLTVTATLNNGATDEIENYELTGEFIVGESEITVAYGEYSQTITVNITAIAVDYIEAEFVQGGVVYHTTELSVLKDWLTVTAHYTDGTSQEITDYELSGAFTVGASQITVTYGAEHTDTVTVTVDKVKVALPTFKGGLKYTGVSLKPKAADFNGYDETLMTFVAEKTVAGLNAGAYKAVFALNDPENNEWATAKTLKKTVFAVTYDEMVLNANEAAVDWNISKAVLTATKTDGGLPVFASESFIGAFADVVTL